MIKHIGGVIQSKPVFKSFLIEHQAIKDLSLVESSDQGKPSSFTSLSPGRK